MIWYQCSFKVYLKYTIPQECEWYIYIYIYNMLYVCYNTYICHLSIYLSDIDVQNNFSLTICDATMTQMFQCFGDWAR